MSEAPAEPAPAAIQRQVLKLTVTYEPLEDRLRLSMLDQNNQQLVLWMTQRMANQLIAPLVKMLDTTLPLPQGAPPAAKPVAQVWKQAEAELQMKKTAPVPPADNRNEHGLIRSVRLHGGDSEVHMEFRWNESESIILPSSHTALRQLLRIIHRKYRDAAWPVDGLWPAWFDVNNQASILPASQIN